MVSINCYWDQDLGDSVFWSFCSVKQALLHFSPLSSLEACTLVGLLDMMGSLSSGGGFVQKHLSEAINVNN